MKHTEEQIIKIVKKIIDDVDISYENGSLTAIYTDLEEQIEQVKSQKEHPKYQEYIETFFPYWTIIFDFPKEENWNERNKMFIEINDNNGEPYKYGHKQFIGKLQKNSNGKYEITERS